MMVRSPQKRGRAVRKKTDRNTPQDSRPADGLGEDGKKAPEPPRLEDSESIEETEDSAFGERDAVTGKGKLIQKLDDQAFKPFGQRSRASSDADAGSDTQGYINCDTPLTSYCRGGPGKPTCDEFVSPLDEGVQCDRCDQWYHRVCQEISKPAHRALKEYKVLAWLCVLCRAAIKRDRKHLADIEGRIEQFDKTVNKTVDIEGKIEQLDRTVEGHMARMIQSLKDQEKSVSAQTKLIENSLKECHTQKTSYAQIVKGSCSEVVDKVSEKLTSLSQLPQQASRGEQNIAKVFDDFLDRDRRKNNLVVHNLPESSAETLTERSDQDDQKVQSMVREAFRLNIKVSKSFRVGKVVPDKHRLLIVTLENPEVKQDVLRLAPQLRGTEFWGNIYITPDLSKAEREAARKLREELSVRKAAGETDLVIKKGRIVSAPGRLNGPSVQASRPTTSDASGSQAEGSSQAPQQAPSVASSSRAGDVTQAKA